MHANRHIFLAALCGLIVSAAPRLAAAQDTLETITVNSAASISFSVGSRITKVAIAAGDIADVAAFEPDFLLVTGKRPGTTTATVWTAGNKVRSYVINVTYPVDTMRKAVRKALKNARKIDVQSAGATILLSGQVSSPEDVERAEKIVRGIAAGAVGTSDVPIVNMLTIPGNQQVLLEVTFAEVSRSSLRQIGFNFWHKNVRSNGRGYAGGVLAPTTSLGGLSPALGTNPASGELGAFGTGFDDAGNALTEAVPLIGSPISGTFGFIFSSTLGNFPFSAAMSLLSQKGYARTLAEPSLVAMSGKSASFLAGGEFPVPIPSSLGQTAIQYQKFGIQLQFTPTVMGDDIQLDLSITVSDIDFSTAVRLEDTQVPGLTSRHSQTVIRLKDGQSFVVAGLLSDKVRSTVDKVPFLGDIPILGALFKSSSYRREESELLVVVTAHLIKPLDERPPLPGENTTTDPGDLELFFFNQHESLETPESERRSPTGAVGFKR